MVLPLSSSKHVLRFLILVGAAIAGGCIVRYIIEKGRKEPQGRKSSRQGLGFSVLLRGGIKTSKQQLSNNIFLDQVDDVQLDDKIYDAHDVMGSSPVVLESHKLVFFQVTKVGATTWLMLFRRMMGYRDWKTANPHAGRAGLIRLKDLDMAEASRIMNSPEYTKAVFVRDPKERFLSVWLDKIKQRDTSIESKCCNGKAADCMGKAEADISGFLELAKTCHDRHWIPQSKLMESKYYSKLDFVGHAETLATNAQELLEKIGAWDEFGKTGWGASGNESIFESLSDQVYTSRKRTRDYWDFFSEVFTPESEAAVESFYAGDYDTPEFQLRRKKINFTKKPFEWKGRLSLGLKDRRRLKKAGAHTIAQRQQKGAMGSYSSSSSPRAMPPSAPASFNRIHVLLFETDGSVIQAPNSPLKYFVETGRLAGINTTLYGEGVKYQGFGDKYVHGKSLLKTIDQDTLVILADARDMILNVPRDKALAAPIISKVLNAFQRLVGENNPDAVVASAEAQCCVSALAHASPEDYFDASGNRNERACPSGKPGCMYVGNLNIERWKSHMVELANAVTGKNPENVFLNAGLLAGSSDALIKLIDKMDLYGYEDDQAVMSGLLFREPTKMILDYEQDLFGNTEWPKGLEHGCRFHEQKGLLAHEETGQTPLLVHTAGKFFSCLDRMLEEIGVASQRRHLQGGQQQEPENYQATPSPTTAVPTVLIIEETQPPSTAEPTRDDGICQDKYNEWFFVDYLNVTKDCIWLSNRHDDIDRLCRRDHSAYHICEDTCGKCVDCDDADDSVVLPPMLISQQMVHGMTCSMLADRPRDQPQACLDPVVREVCPDTCHACPTAEPTTAAPTAEETDNILIADTIAPTTVQPVCDDARRVTFTVLTKEKDCAWLQSRLHDPIRPSREFPQIPSDWNDLTWGEALCGSDGVVTGAAFDICLESCGQCEDNCEDARVFYDAGGNQRTCAWLASNDRSIDIFCNEGGASTAAADCGETCGTCD